MDQEGNPTPEGTEGNLWVKGASAALCYWNKPEVTAATFVDDWVRTGDLYRQDADGYWYHMGRSDDCFKSSGQWVSPVEVEGVLLKHDAVNRVAVVQDFDGNGFPDIFVTNFSEELNTLYQNRGDGIFEDVSEKAGLGSGYLPLGFGTKMFDFDNDGDLDIYVTNGHVIDNIKLYQPALSYAQKDLLYENIGGRFRDVSSQSGAVFQAERVGRGLAVGDFDNDGNLDVVIANLGGPPVLLRNQGVSGGNWIVIRAKGRKSNSFGLGATVEVETSDKKQVKEINNVASYLSSNDIRLHFGLGKAKTIQRIEVRWPSGLRQVLTDVAVNQILAVEEPEK